jgi:uncharacterized protein
MEVPAGKIDYNSSITQSSSLQAEGKAELLSSALGEVRIRGKLSVRVDTGCDRCLENATVAIDNAFDLVYLPATEAQAGGEDEVAEAALEVGFYEGEGIELNDVFREVVLLALPMQVFCHDACKGICPVCGQNRNSKDCDCALESTDDRWSKLKAFKAEVTPGN